MKINIVIKDVKFESYFPGLPSCLGGRKDLLLAVNGGGRAIQAGANLSPDP